MTGASGELPCASALRCTDVGQMCRPCTHDVTSTARVAMQQLSKQQLLVPGTDTRALPSLLPSSSSRPDHAPTASWHRDKTGISAESSISSLIYARGHVKEFDHHPWNWARPRRTPAELGAPTQNIFRCLKHSPPQPSAFESMDTYVQFGVIHTFCTSDKHCNLFFWRTDANGAIICA